MLRVLCCVALFALLFVIVLLIAGGCVGYLVVFAFWVFADVGLGCLFVDGIVFYCVLSLLVYYRLVAIEIVWSAVLLRLVDVVVFKVCGVVLGFA